MGALVNDTGEALLSAVLAEPDSSDLRLILADWLQDNNEPEWGELMRLQVLQAQARQAAAKKPEGRILRIQDDPSVAERIAELCPVAGQRWLARWALMGQWNGTRFEVREKDRLLFAVTFHRGLPEELWCQLQDWQAHLDVSGLPWMRDSVRILRLLPWGRMGREIRLYLDRLLGDERIARLDTLDLSGLFDHVVHGGHLSSSAVGCFWSVLKQYFRPWQGLRELVMPGGMTLPITLEQAFGSQLTTKFSSTVWWR